MNIKIQTTLGTVEKTVFNTGNIITACHYDLGFPDTSDLRIITKDGQRIMGSSMVSVDAFFNEGDTVTVADFGGRV
jgi:hypothetical protein